MWTVKRHPVTGKAEFLFGVVAHRIINNAG